MGKQNSCRQVFDDDDEDAIKKIKYVLHHCPWSWNQGPVVHCFGPSQLCVILVL